MSDQSERFSAGWLDAYLDMMQPGWRVLDLGCGPGDDSLDLLQAGMRVVGLDRSLAIVHEAAVRVQQADFVVADMMDGLPFQ